MRNLYIDFDGVIMDTITNSYKMIKELGIDLNDSEKVIAFYKELNWEKLLNESLEIHDAFDEIDKLIKSGKFHVNILTHVTSLNEAEAKINFVRQKLQEISIITVPKSIDKARMVQAKNSILIDDYIGNLEKWKAAGGIGVRFSTKLNGKGFQAIAYLNQIIELVKDVEMV